MKTFFKQVSSINTLSFLEWSLKDMVKNGRDSFEISRMCFQWSNDTGLPAYDFREALEAHLNGVSCSSK